jgi:hypothetical protein
MVVFAQMKEDIGHMTSLFTCADEHGVALNFSIQFHFHSIHTHADSLLAKMDFEDYTFGIYSASSSNFFRSC